jgi:hypothetical protein
MGDRCRVRRDARTPRPSPLAGLPFCSFYGVSPPAGTMPLRSRRTSLITLLMLGSGDSLLKLMKQPQFGHWLWNPSRTREIRSRNPLRQRLHVTLILSVMGVG